MLTVHLHHRLGFDWGDGQYNRIILKEMVPCLRKQCRNYIHFYSEIHSLKATGMLMFLGASTYVHQALFAFTHTLTHTYRGVSCKKEPYLPCVRPFAGYHRYIYMYIYIYVCVCVCQLDPHCARRLGTNVIVKVSVVSSTKFLLHSMISDTLSFGKRRLFRIATQIS